MAYIQLYSHIYYIISAIAKAIYDAKNIQSHHEVVTMQPISYAYNNYAMLHACSAHKFHLLYAHVKGIKLGVSQNKKLIRKWYA